MFIYREFLPIFFETDFAGGASLSESSEVNQTSDTEQSDAVETDDVQDTGESASDEQDAGMPQQQTSVPQPKLIPESDFNKLRSIKDREIAAANQRLQQAQQQLTQALAQQQAYEKQLFELQVAQLPQEQQQPAREMFAQQQKEQQYQAAIAGERMQRQQLMNQIEPLARELTIQTLASEYGCPRAILEQAATPQAMEIAAKTYKTVMGQVKGQVRQQRKADVAEGGSGQVNSVDLVKKFRNTGDAFGMLRAMRQAGR